jgi:hypothetical protein
MMLYACLDPTMTHTQTRLTPSLPVGYLHASTSLLSNLRIDNTSPDSDRSTLSSVTLNGSGRSTPQASSIRSGLSAPFQAPLVYKSGYHRYEELPLRTGQPNSAPLWPTYPSTNVRNTPQLALRMGALPKARDGLLDGHSPEVSTLQANAHVKMLHFCVYCYELGTLKSIGTKQDWKRHQEDYHPGTGNEWHCQYKGCHDIFDQGLPFKKHVTTHGKAVLPRDCKEVKQQQRVYACGFENCRELNYNWRCFCDHLSIHMMKGHIEWSYDRTIRNLLKQSTFHWTWKETYGDLAPRLNVLPSQLTWDPSNTRRMKQKLEYHQFGTSLEELLREIFFAGLPQFNQHATAAPLPPPDFPPPPPPAPASSVFSNAPTIPSNSFEHAGHEPSHPESPAPDTDAEQAANEVQPASSGYRNSYSMAEAPPLLPDFEAQGFYFFPEVDAAHEVISVENFIHESTADNYNATLPLSPPPPAEENSSPPESKRSHSKGLLNWARKRSQHFQQPFAIEHPDVPLNTRMPASPPKKTAATYTMNPAAGVYSFQA